MTMQWLSNIVHKPRADIVTIRHCAPTCCLRNFLVSSSTFYILLKSHKKTARNAAGNRVQCINFVYRTSGHDLPVLLNNAVVLCANWCTLRCSKTRHPVRLWAAGGQVLIAGRPPGRQLLRWDTIRFADLVLIYGRANILDIKHVSIFCNTICSRVFNLTDETAQTMQQSESLVRFEPKSYTS